jgi:hypothetical protein
MSLQVKQVFAGSALEAVLARREAELEHPARLLSLQRSSASLRDGEWIEIVRQEGVEAVQAFASVTATPQSPG